MCELKVSGSTHEFMCCDDDPRIKKCHWCLRRYLHTHKRDWWG
jgi:hypothetical protein